MQRNPFFEELISEELQRSPPFAPCSSSGSSPFHYTTLPAQSCTPVTAREVEANMVSIKRERPRPVARQISLPTLLPNNTAPNPPNHSAPPYMSESGAGEWEDSFDAFASSRLNSPKGSAPPKQLRASPTSSRKRSYPPVNNYAQELHSCKEEPPPLPPRRLLRTSLNEIYSDGWLHRGQELAVHKEAYLLSQTGVASLQRGKEGECKKNSVSPDAQTSSDTSESLGIGFQPYTNVTSPGSTSEEKLKKFKYEPLEYDADCWGGMLFEQDLYGRVCRGNYGQPKVNSHRLSLNSEDLIVLSKNSGPKMLPGSETPVNSSNTPSNPDVKVLDISPTPEEETAEAHPPESCINNNISFSLTLGDLNMNVNNSDFGFIDSDGSPQSEAADTVKRINSLDGSLTQPSEDSQVAVFHEAPTLGELFTLKDTYIPEMNSSFEMMASSNKMCKVSPVCQDKCQDCDLNAPHGHSRTNSRDFAALLVQDQSSDLTELESAYREEKIRGDDGIKKTHEDFDDNGNPDAKLAKPNQPEPFSGVVSARFRPKGVSRQSSSDSPNSQSKSGDREFEQFLSLVQNISEVSEGPLSYQPSKSTLSSLQILNKQTDLLESSTSNDGNELNIMSEISLNDNTTSENCVREISFKDLHAKVAPNSRIPSKAKIGQSLQEPDPSSPSIPSALSLSADTSVCCPSLHPSSTGPSAGDSTTLAVAPYTSSYSNTSTTDQPLVAARHSLLPEESQPASNLPHQESR